MCRSIAPAAKLPEVTFEFKKEPFLPKLSFVKAGNFVCECYFCRLAIAFFRAIFYVPLASYSFGFFKFWA